MKIKATEIFKVCFAIALILTVSVVFGHGKEPLKNAFVSENTVSSNSTYAEASLTTPTVQTTSFATQTSEATEISESIAEYRLIQIEPQEPSTQSEPQETTIQFRQEAAKVKNGIFFDATDDTVLWKKKANEKISPASLTKLLTAYTALKYTSPKTVFTVGSELSFLNEHSSLCLIQKGHRLKLYDLLCGMLMMSGNDAAYTIAVNTARLVNDKEMTDREALRAFYDLMNLSAKEIGMRNSYFCSPDGFDTEGQYTTVNDLLKLSRCVYNDDIIKKIVKQPRRRVVFESGQTIAWKNTNLLLDSKSEFYCPWVTGMKTGTSENAGKCLIASAEINGKLYFAIVMGCETDNDRFKLPIKMFDKLL